MPDDDYAALKRHPRTVPPRWHSTSTVGRKLNRDIVIFTALKVGIRTTKGYRTLTRDRDCCNAQTMLRIYEFYPVGEPRRSLVFWPENKQTTAAAVVLDGAFFAIYGLRNLITESTCPQTPLLCFRVLGLNWLKQGAQ